MAAEKLHPKEVGSKSWAEKMRASAHDVAKRLETGYMDLAKILWDLYDVPVEGNPNNGPWFKQWGYSDLGEYTEAELGIHRRKAQYLRGIYYRLTVELSDMDDILRQRIISLGWSKVRELIKVLTTTNAAQWVTLAETINYPDLCSSIQEYRHKLETAHAAKDKGEPYTAPIPQKVIKPKKFDNDLPVSSWNQEASGYSSPIALGDSTAVVPAPPPPLTSLSSVPSVPETVEEEPELAPMRILMSENEKFYPRNFALPSDLRDLLDSALIRAAELSNSSSNSHNLGIICQDFLATNTFGKADQSQLLRFLTKYESLLNVRIVVIDRDDEPLYGMSHLEALAKKFGNTP